MKSFIVFGFALAAAGVAAADTLSIPTVSGDQQPIFASDLPLGGTRDGINAPYNVTGTPSHNAQADGGNAVVNFDLAAALGFASGTPVTMNGIGWDVTLFADVNVGPFGGSWLSEVTVGFSADGDTSPDFQLSPGAGNNFSGTATFANPVIKLGDVGLPNLSLPNGVLRMEFYELFDDDAAFDDGAWVNGALTLQAVPEPASFGLLVLGGLLLRRRS